MAEIVERQAIAMLSRLEQEYNLRLHLIRRFERGDDGAYLVEDYAGRRLVLKWRPWHEGAAEASRLTARRLARMRERGCPVPVEVAGGRIGESVFELQDIVREIGPENPRRAGTGFPGSGRCPHAGAPNLH